MAPGHTGFDGDGLRGQRFDGLYMGKVVDRNDPDGRGRIRVQIPGVIDEQSAWAVPKGGGSPRWGVVWVPPLDADVYVQFINGDQEHPVYEPADYGIRDGKPEVFPEYEDPDVIVAGFGPFRLVIDLREDTEAGVAPSLTLKMVATIGADEQGQGGEETDTAWIRIGENSVQVRADAAVQVTSGAITDIDSDGDVQVRRRKVMPASRPIA